MPVFDGLENGVWQASIEQPIHSGDIAWMLTSTARVLMMTIPGLALVYGGMVRVTNVLSTLMQVYQHRVSNYGV